MRMKTIKPKLVLLDANIIIYLHELGIWSEIIERVEIIIPSIIFNDEAAFYRSKDNNKLPIKIDLAKNLNDGKIILCEAEAMEMIELKTVFNPGFAESIHDGEAEALAILKRKVKTDLKFCTADYFAIQALAMLGFSEHGISLEVLLSAIGFQKIIKYRYTEKCLQDQLRIGCQNRITGSGLANNK
jgi:hypothetical protein